MAKIKKTNRIKYLNNPKLRQEIYKRNVNLLRIYFETLLKTKEEHLKGESREQFKIRCFVALVIEAFHMKDNQVDYVVDHMIRGTGELKVEAPLSNFADGKGRAYTTDLYLEYRYLEVIKKIWSRAVGSDTSFAFWKGNKSIVEEINEYKKYDKDGLIINKLLYFEFTKRGDLVITFEVMSKLSKRVKEYMFNEGFELVQRWFDRTSFNDKIRNSHGIQGYRFILKRKRIEAIL